MWWWVGGGSSQLLPSLNPTTFLVVLLLGCDNKFGRGWVTENWETADVTADCSLKSKKEMASDQGKIDF